MDPDEDSEDDHEKSEAALKISAIYGEEAETKSYEELCGMKPAVSIPPSRCILLKETTVSSSCIARDPRITEGSPGASCCPPTVEGDSSSPFLFVGFTMKGRAWSSWVVPPMVTLGPLFASWCLHLGHKALGITASHSKSPCFLVSLRFFAKQGHRFFPLLCPRLTTFRTKWVRISAVRAAQNQKTAKKKT